MNDIKRKQGKRLTDVHLERLTVIITTNCRYVMKEVKDKHAASTRPGMKVNMLSMEDVLAALLTRLYVEMLVCVWDSVYGRESVSPLDFAAPMWLLWRK